MANPPNLPPSALLKLPLPICLPLANSDPVKLTVAIPTYNGATRLPPVLDRLRTQANVPIAWEVLVVNNNSTDDTVGVVEQAQLDWPADIPLRLVHESQQGAAFARIRAISEAQGELVGLLDDDVLPDADWVAQIWKFAQAYPQAGAYGSQIHGEFEVPPPERFERIAGFFGITERGPDPLLYTPESKMLPPSAGLVVRRQAWLNAVPPRPFLAGRSPHSLFNNSEDLEAILHIQNAGWEIWYNPAMVSFHQIPARRLSRESLRFIMRSTGLARHYIRMLRFAPWQRPGVLLAGLLRDCYKAACFFWHHRDRLATDVVAAGEMEFLRYSIISPLYVWREHWRRARQRGRR
ncbi:MAG: hormogonium polysaccharide biosynthesis glycosyltransferase HpsE [Cyanobacteria bacterium P01_G01_bin.54]